MNYSHCVPKNSSKSPATAIHTRAAANKITVAVIQSSLCVRTTTADSPLQSLPAPRIVGGLKLPLNDWSSRYPVIPVPGEEGSAERGRQASAGRTRRRTRAHARTLTCTVEAPAASQTSMGAGFHRLFPSLARSLALSCTCLRERVG